MSHRTKVLVSRTLRKKLTGLFDPIYTHEDNQAKSTLGHNDYRLRKSYVYVCT